MLSACPTHAAVQKLKPSSIHVPLILPEQELCQCSHTDKPLLHKTLAMLSLHNQYKKKNQCLKHPQKCSHDTSKLDLVKLPGFTVGCSGQKHLHWTDVQGPQAKAQNKLMGTTENPSATTEQIH